MEKDQNATSCESDHESSETLTAEKIPQSYSESGQGSSEINESASSFDIENLSASTSDSGNDDCPEFDLGKWLGKSFSMTRPQKLEMLKKCWVPPKGYDFAKDVADSRLVERCFIHDWLTSYAPWLSYSKKLKGALCLYCVLFPLTVVQGVLGAFSTTSYNRYKHMHEACKNHAQSKWHKQSTKSAMSFMNDLPVIAVATSSHQSLIDKNRKILSSIISTIIFCGTHHLPLRGKESKTGK